MFCYIYIIDTNLQTNGIHLNNREKIIIDDRPRRNSLADCTLYSYDNNIKQEEINVDQKKKNSTSADVLKNVSVTTPISKLTLIFSPWSRFI